MSASDQRAEAEPSGGVVSAARDDLRRLAEAATPGPWTVEYDTCECGGDYPCSHGKFPYAMFADSDRADGSSKARNITEFAEASNEDAAFLAAMSPTTVLVLLDELDRQWRAIEQMAPAAGPSYTPRWVLDALPDDDEQP